MTRESSFDPKAFLETLTQKPGVYRMHDASGTVIYVGKAKNLKKRVSSYFSGKEATPRQQAMVARIRDISVSVTHTEGEALLLESQLIKQHQPRYNISLRDDKSYPYIYVSTQQPFPRLSFHRGAKSKQGRYFGPYPSASAVRETLKLLQNIFPVRQCEDSFFRHRSRPCLQYQIERCSGPCVGLVTEADYADDVADTLLFLEGKGNALIDRWVARMEQAARLLQFERAATCRDQIAILRSMLERQAVHGEEGDLDIMACSQNGVLACVQVLVIRGGLQIGDRAYFPQLPAVHEPAAILAAFIPQYCLGKPIPREIILSHPIEDPALMEEALARQAGHPVRVTAQVRGERMKRVQLALTNAETALQARMASRQDILGRFMALGEALGLAAAPRRLECFDISHTQGELTVASCVVFDTQGPLKSAYRRFNIEGIVPGDDYAALAQAVTRHYRRIQAGEAPTPDILFIDGGKGQVRSVQDALASLGMDAVRIIGVAKGPDRKPGQECLYPAGVEVPIMLPTHSPALLLIQQIRDEAHRFAITGHRQRRAKARQKSSLEDIPGLGPKRRQQLLKQFGGLREISRASVEALARIEGISIPLAQRIHDTFHDREQ